MSVLPIVVLKEGEMIGVMKCRVGGSDVLVSVLPTFYDQLLRTKVKWSAFLYIQHTFECF